MDKDTQSKTHPAFVEIIKQLTPDEAIFLKSTSILKIAIPVCALRYQEKSTFLNTDNYILHPEHILRNSTAGQNIISYYLGGDINNRFNPLDISFMIENFLRLKLIDCPNGQKLVDPHSYQNFYKDDFIKSIVFDKNNLNRELALIPLVLMPTSLGTRFYQMCIE